MDLLPHWNLTNLKPGFYDTESGTSIEMTAKVYKAMNDLITEYNTFAVNVNSKIKEFMSDVNSDNELFRIGLRQEFQDFINVVELKIESLDQYAKNEVGKAIQELYKELKESNEITDLFGDQLGELANKVESLTSDLTEQMNQTTSNLREEVNQTTSNLREEVNQTTSNLREEVNQTTSELREDVNQVSTELREADLHSIRIPSFEEIDNTPFKQLFKSCADSWYYASNGGGIVYGSLDSDGAVDNLATRVNPMIYSTRENQVFTGVYRDILSETKAGGTKSMNCITLCNMLIMGVPFEFSRFNNHENVVGVNGYAFDVCKYLDSTKNGDTVFYNPNKKLDVTTFERILSQASFIETYDALGLVKNVKTSKSSTEEGIWYDEIKPGDVMYTGTHTMFCLDVSVSGETTTITYIDSGSNNEPSITKHTLTATSTGSSKNVIKVIRPYYNYCEPNLMVHGRYKFKSLEGPYLAIPSGSDLNTYLTPGEYRCASGGNTESLINKPSTVTDPFKLTVENITTDPFNPLTYNYIKQTITTAFGTMYYRAIKCDKSFNAITFYPWKGLTPVEVS